MIRCDQLTTDHHFVTRIALDHTQAGRLSVQQVRGRIIQILVFHQIKDILRWDEKGPDPEMTNRDLVAEIRLAILVSVPDRVIDGRDPDHGMMMTTTSTDVPEECATDRRMVELEGYMLGICETKRTCVVQSSLILLHQEAVSYTHLTLPTIYSV